MNCNKSLELMSLYLDNELDKNMSLEFINHIENCESCKEEFEILKSVVNDLKEIPLEDLPENFHDELISKIEDLNINEKSGKLFKFKKFDLSFYKKFASVAAIFIILVVSGSFGISLLSNNNNKDYSARSTESSPPETANGSLEMAPQMAKSSIADSEAPEDQNFKVTQDNALASDAGMVEENKVESNISERKIIKNLFVTINVLSFDSAFNTIKNIANENGGYIENYYSDIYYDNATPIKQGNVTLRMPEEKYEIIKENLASLGTIENENENTEDVTSQYIDTEGKLKMKKIEEERLLDLLKKAESVEDILKIETELSNVRTDIEAYTSSIQNWDKLIKFSTITINLNETENGSINNVNPDLKSKIKQNFIKSINSIISFSENVLLFFAQYITPLIIVIVLILIFWYFLKLIIKKHKK